MDEPTKAQKREFWERYGFRFPGEQIDSCMYPDGSFGITPSIDLNSLFEYAVPKLCELDGFRLLNYQFIGFARDIQILRHGWGIHFENDDFNKYQSGNDPALALFWAVWKVIHNG